MGSEMCIRDRLIVFGCYTFYGFFTKDIEGSMPSMTMNCMKMDDESMDGMKMNGMNSD